MTKTENVTSGEAKKRKVKYPLPKEIKDRLSNLAKYYEIQQATPADLFDELLVPTDIEECVVGVDTNEQCFICSYEIALEHFMKEMSYDDAIEWMDFNVVGAKGKHYPKWIYKQDEDPDYAEE